jgi:ABC-type multidrug transport system fused ATPase/permease subunit
LVIEDGRLVGQGDHTELLAANPAYRRLYERQWASGSLDEALSNS